MARVASRADLDCMFSTDDNCTRLADTRVPQDPTGSPPSFPACYECARGQAERILFYDSAPTPQRRKWAFYYLVRAILEGEE